MARLRIFCALSLSIGLGACSFNTGGLGADDDDDNADIDAAVAPPDADPDDPDAAPGTPDAAPEADAAPPDTDDDGVIDAEDNCPTIENTDQYNEDGDDHGDACDNCPHVVNDAQTDDREAQNGHDPDDVGDACDPRPDLGGDSIVFFDGFHGNALSSQWAVGASTGSNEWMVDGGSLIQPNDEIASNLLLWDSAALNRVVVDTHIVVDDIAPLPPVSPDDPPPSRAAGVVAAFTDTGTVGTGYGCMQYVDLSEIDPSTWASVYSFDTTEVFGIEWQLLPWDIAIDGAYDYRMRFNDASVVPITCAYFNGVTGPEVDSSTDTVYDGGQVGIRTYGVVASIPYVVVYQLGPPGDGVDPGDQP